MTIEKSKKLDYVGYDIRGPVADEADLMTQQGIDIIKLNTGNPAAFGFRAPKYILEDLIQNNELSQAYSHSKGILPAREAIAAYCKTKNIPDVTPNDVFTGNGVSELISMTMQGLLDNGDEILIPSPDYPLWTSAATLAGGTAVHYQCDEEAEWYPDINDIRQKITRRTKAIVIINPNNPTGALYSRELLLEIIEIARQHNLVIFSDEIYDRLVMDGLEHISTASLAPDLFVVTFNGLSKSHQLAGFRCGWICLSGNKHQARSYIEGINMLASMRLCSNVLSQTVIKNALEDYRNADHLLMPGGRIYEQREYITNAINDIPGLSVVKPKSAFYLFPKIDVKKFHIANDEQFVLDFLRKQHVLLTHGGGFNWKSPDHFRLVYLPEVETLKMISQKLHDFLEDYQQC